MKSRIKNEVGSFSNKIDLTVRGLHRDNPPAWELKVCQDMTFSKTYFINFEDYWQFPNVHFLWVPISVSKISLGASHWFLRRSIEFETKDNLSLNSVWIRNVKLSRWLNRSAHKFFEYFIKFQNFSWKLMGNERKRTFFD